MNNDINKTFDDYYNDSNIIRKKRNNLIKKEIAIGLVAITVFCSGKVLAKPKLKIVDNPFNGCEIIIDDNLLNKMISDLNKYVDDDDFYNNTINDMTLSEKSKQLLLYAYYSNNSIHIKNLDILKSYLCYLEDNSYSNYEEIYDKLNTLIVRKRFFIGNGVLGNYNYLNNLINITDVDSSYLHEIMHMDDNCKRNSKYSTMYYKWISEGTAEVLASEYYNVGSTTYPVECAAIRLITRLVGSDLILKMRQEGNQRIIVDELIKKGANKEEIIKLFDLLEKNISNPSSDNRVEIAREFTDLYAKLNKNDYMDSIYGFDIFNIMFNNSINHNEIDYYLFNKKYCNKNQITYINKKSDGGYVKSIYKNDYCINYFNDDYMEEKKYTVSNMYDFFNKIIDSKAK